MLQSPARREENIQTDRGRNYSFPEIDAFIYMSNIEYSTNTTAQDTCTQSVVTRVDRHTIILIMVENEATKQ